MIRVIIIERTAKKIQIWSNFVTIKCLGITSKQLNELHYQSGALKLQLLESSPVAFELPHLL